MERSLYLQFIVSSGCGDGGGGGGGAEGRHSDRGMDAQKNRV